MGTEASYQAIPEGCELLNHARQDWKIAECMQFFNSVAVHGFLYPSVKEGSEEEKFAQSVSDLINEYPTLLQRYFYAGRRTYDIIVYLLSPARRALTHRNSVIEKNNGLIEKATYGSEFLHPSARATQGFPIGFVPAVTVQIISDYMEKITFEQFREFYDPSAMEDAGVYKMYASADDIRLHSSWDEFNGMRTVYRESAIHEEAVITVID